MSQTKFYSRGLYPGSFDPLTCAHIDMVKRFSKLFEELTVLVASSIHKKYWFSIEEREQMVRQALTPFSNVRVVRHDGLTAEYLKKNKIPLVLRAIRSLNDFSYERDLAENNKKIFPEMETLFLFSSAESETISASWIKEIAFHKGSLKGLVPLFVQKKIEQKMQRKDDDRRGSDGS